LSDEYQRRGPNRITRELEISVAELELAVGKKPRLSHELPRAFTKKSTKKFSKKAAANSGR